MQDLELVGVSDDGEHLVLADPDGQRFRVLIDESLRAAVRRDRARLGQLQIEVGTHLRPADIQARIRAGQSAQDVADAAGVPLEHVRRYEGPVLAEREHVANQARRVQVRRRDGARAAALGELVEERLGARGVQATAAVWDSWRRQDGTWAVQLSFTAGGKDRRACWTFDLARSSVEPRDDEARWLSEESGGDRGLIPGRRLSAVHDRVYDVEADGGVRPVGETDTGSGPDDRQDDAIDDLPDRPAPVGLAALDLLDALRERRGRRGRRSKAGVEDGDLFEDPDILTDLLGDVPAAHPPASRPDEAVDAEIVALPDAEATTEEESDPDSESTVGSEATGADEHATPEPAAKNGRAGAAKSGGAKAKRASVPSWDEIVFGAKKD